LGGLVIFLRSWMNGAGTAQGEQGRGRIKLREQRGVHQEMLRLGGDPKRVSAKRRRLT